MSPEPQSMVPIIATRAQQVVLIGDHKQLRPIIKCQPAAELGLDQSLFERLFLKFPAYTAFLSTQYRMVRTPRVLQNDLIVSLSGTVFRCECLAVTSGQSALGRIFVLYSTRAVIVRFQNLLRALIQS